MPRRAWLALPLTAILLAAGAVAVDAADAPHILSGVTVAGLDVGGLTVEEAAKRLEGTPRQGGDSVTVHLPNGDVTVKASDLGWRVDALASARSAHGTGREGGILGRLGGRFAAMRGALSVDPVVVVDERALRSKLEALGATLRKPAQDAKIVFGAGRYGIRLDRPGQKANVETAAAAFVADPNSTEIILETTSVPASLRAEQVRASVEKANSLLRPLKLVYIAPVTVGGVQAAWSQSLSPTQVADLFFVRRDGIEIDEKTIARAVERLAGAFDKLPKSARYRTSGPAATNIVREPDRRGWTLDQEAARIALASRITDPGASSVLLYASEAAPAVRLQDLPDPGSLTVISEGNTSFKGSSLARATNVRVAARRLDGAVIPPGGEFSFNDAIGSIDLEAGFKAALVISGGRTVEGVGGGVCQVSTTAFRALYRAGFPVVERNQHAYRVRWYEPEVGFDAAVYQPVLDLRMRNDLDSAVLIRSFIDEERGTLTVRVYGLPMNRKVVVSNGTILERTPHPPAAYEVDASLRPGQTRQVDWATDGYKVRITRKIFDAEGVRMDELLTNYRPWRAVYLVGPSGSAN
jgi:vancomycin resistance protein YoaR